MQLVGGTGHAMIGYMSAENQAEKATTGADDEISRWMIGFGYEYPLSKRTSIYGIAGAFWQDADWQEDDITAHEAIVGLMHRF